MRAATIFLLLIAAVVSATPIGALYIDPVRGPRSIPDLVYVSGIEAE